MKVILLEDVKSLGKKGDVVDISDGYANNMILPKKLGIEATPGNMKGLANQKKREEKDAAALLEQAKQQKEELEKLTIPLRMKGGEGGKVFGSVSGKEIAAAAKEAFGVDIDRKKIVLGDPIKQFGEYEVPLKLHPQVTATLKVIIEES